MSFRDEISRYAARVTAGYRHHRCCPAASFVLPLLRFALLGATFAPLASLAEDRGPDTELTLAGFWAPVLVQGTEYDFRSDVITRIEIEGHRANGDGEASKRSGGGRGLASSVYYHVLDSASHYYLTYSFYHLAALPLADGSEPAVAYQHDLQSVVLAIAKSGGAMGRFSALAVVDAEPALIAAEASILPASDRLHDSWEKRVAVATGVKMDVDFVIDNLGVHPVLYADAAQHTLQVEKARSTIDQGPAVFEQQAVVDWRWIPTVVEGGQAELRTRYHRPGNVIISGGSSGSVPRDDGLLYRYEDHAMEVVQGDSKGRGTVLHHWNLIAYDLLPLADLMAEQEGATSGSLFGPDGSLATAGVVGATNRLPWINSWFKDPAGLFGKHKLTE